MSRNVAIRTKVADTTTEALCNLLQAAQVLLTEAEGLLLDPPYHDELAVDGGSADADLLPAMLKGQMAFRKASGIECTRRMEQEN